MALLGITEEEQSDIFAVLAAILHLGNVTFSTNEKNTAVVHDEESTWCTMFVWFYCTDDTHSTTHQAYGWRQTSCGLVTTI